MQPNFFLSTVTTATKNAMFVSGHREIDGTFCADNHEMNLG